MNTLSNTPSEVRQWQNAACSEILLHPEHDMLVSQVARLINMLGEIGTDGPASWWQAKRQLYCEQRKQDAALFYLSFLSFFIFRLRPILFNVRRILRTDSSDGCSRAMCYLPFASVGGRPAPNSRR
jgi:hypothetical protein